MNETDKTAILCVTQEKAGVRMVVAIKSEMKHLAMYLREADLK